MLAAQLGHAAPWFASQPSRVMPVPTGNFAAWVQGDYYEAVAKAVDVKRKELVACFPKDAGLDEACFKISYDILIVGVRLALAVMVTSGRW